MTRSVTSDGPKPHLRVEPIGKFRRRLRNLVSLSTIRELVRAGDLDLVSIAGKRRVVTHYFPAGEVVAR